MRDYSKLPDALRADAESSVSDDMVTALYIAADAIEELQAQVPKWISVEDEPIPHEWVWGVYRQTVCGQVMQHHITVKMYGDNIIDQNGNVYNGFISHWMRRMPLPEPPKEVTS